MTRLHPEAEDLQNLFKRYLACIEAIAQTKSVAWTGTGNKPNQNDVTTIFIKKTQWYNWRTGFQKILSNYPDMRAWLEETDKKKIEKDALEVWGVQKARYSLADLTEWVEHGGAFLEDEKEKKEKEKEKTRKKKKASGLSR